MVWGQKKYALQHNFLLFDGGAALAFRMYLQCPGPAYVMDHPCTIYTVSMHSSCTINALLMHSPCTMSSYMNGINYMNGVKREG